MDLFTGYSHQLAIFATTESINSIEQDDNMEEDYTTTNTGTDWILITFLALVACLICYQLQFYEPETGDFSQHAPPLARATLGIARRLGADLARFLLNILAIIAQLFLEAGHTFVATFRKIGRGFKLVIAALEPYATDVWRRYDSAKHSHHANAARQYSRDARAFFIRLLPWAIVFGAIFNIFVVPYMGNGISLEDYDIRHYVVPVWVIKARPENRHYEGSSSHYRRDPVDLQSIEEEVTHAHLLEHVEMVEDSHEVQEQPVIVTRTVMFAETRASDMGSAGGKDTETIENFHEIEEQPVTVTQTVIFAETRASETGPASGKDTETIESSHGLPDPVTITRTLVFAET
jgi:hypothetical protein